MGKLAGRSRGETIRYCSQWSFMLPGGKYLFSMSARRGFTSTPFLWVCFLFSFLGKTSFDPDITSCILLAYGSMSISCPAKQRLTSSDGVRGSSLTSGKVSAQLVQRLCKKLKTSDLTSWSLIVWTGFSGTSNLRAVACALLWQPQKASRSACCLNVVCYRKKKSDRK